MDEYKTINKMDFEVRIEDGEIYIDEEFVAQLCWTSDAIASAITIWLEENAREE